MKEKSEMIETASRKKKTKKQTLPPGRFLNSAVEDLLSHAGPLCLTATPFLREIIGAPWNFLRLH